MKYKAKISIQGTNIVPDLIKDSIHSDENYEGVIVFIPFTDTKFFETVKTRKFEIEVSEENMNEFSYLLGIRGYHSKEGNDSRWTVTEITKPTKTWINNYRTSTCNAFTFTDQELESIDIDDFKATYQTFYKLQGVKWIKDQFGKGLKESKELADFIYALNV